MQPDPTPIPTKRRTLLGRLFARRESDAKLIADALYEQIVAAARQPMLYSAFSVPDTPLGRFEMISLHLFLVLRRIRGAAGPLQEIAQELTDGFFREVDHSLRELGIGDLGVPKRMKKLARMFYGRVASYGEALDRDDAEALAAALTRNVRPDAAAWPEAGELARHVQAVAKALDEQALDGLQAGRVGLTAPREIAP
ncbi:MAG: ubiquinol-cytochrome C chaperone [Rhizobiaceae bacterium]|nr:ubiquinol-cytochrome C chaperone [Rhizobiaceae bacterium]